MVTSVAAPQHVRNLNEPLRDFVKRKGGLNRCAARFAESSRATELATYRPKPAFCAPKSIL